MGKFVSATPAALTTATTNQEQVLGSIAVLSGNTYMYVKVSASSANAGSAGRLMYATATAFNVSDDYTGGDGLPEFVRGVCIGTIAKGSYGWILVDGDYDDVLKATGAITIGDKLATTTTDGKCNTLAGSTYTAGLSLGEFGIATESVTSAITTVSALIKCAY